MLSIGRKAESLGYDSLSVNDHIVFRINWLDSLSILSAVAAVTNRIKLGTSVLNIVSSFSSSGKIFLKYVITTFSLAKDLRFNKGNII
jgi:hypothetical protein